MKNTGYADHPVPREKLSKAWKLKVAQLVREGSAPELNVAVINGATGNLIRFQVCRRMPQGARATVHRQKDGRDRPTRAWLRFWKVK